MKKLFFAIILGIVALPCMADNDSTTVASFSVTPATTRDTIIANIGDTLLFAEFTVTQINMKSTIEMYIVGSNREQWILEKETITDSIGTVKVWYAPNAVGSHSARLSFSCTKALNSFTSRSLSGVCIDPENMPTIILENAPLPQFTAQVGKTASDTLKFSSENCVDFINTSISPAGTGFTIIGTMFPKNWEGRLPIDFSPTQEGTFSATISLTTKYGETKTVVVTGVATAADPTEQDWTTSFNWDMNDPLSLLREDFESLTTDDHNKTLKISRWQNVVTLGSRPWYGYLERDVPLVGNIEERCAKATGFVFGKSEIDSAEMWLVTPPLDFVNAKSKIFTFRVRGDYMFDNHNSTIGLYYIDTVPGEDLLMQQIEVDMPTTSDQNGEWFEFHIDLSGQNIADVFFMGFRYNGQFGNTNSVVYYIDDVSWGRTDIPVISTDSTQLTAITAPSVALALDSVTVTTKNLEECVSLTLGGDHKSKFKLSADTLGLSGGRFAVTFQSDDLGVHEAYVKLSSRGAADKYVPMAVLVKDASAVSSTSIDRTFVWTDHNTLCIQSEQAHNVALYTTDGRCLWTGNAASVNIALPATGVYLVKIDGEIVKIAAH